MALILRNSLPRPLTHDELDSNFQYLNIIPWEKKAYQQGQYVIYGTGATPSLYYCEKGHTDYIYTQNNDEFTESYTENNQTVKIWTKINGGVKLVSGSYTNGVLELVNDDGSIVDITLNITGGTTYDAVSLSSNPNNDVCTGGTGNPADVYAGKDNNVFEFRAIKALDNNITVTYDDCFIYIGGKAAEPIGSTITVTNNTCYGQSIGQINIYVTGGTGSYRFSKDGGTTWTSFGTSNTHIYTGLAAGTYNVKVEDEGLGVVVNTNKTVTQPALVTFTTNVTNVSVVGQSDGSIQVNASGGNGDYEYSFDGGTTYSSNDTLSGASETSYSVIVRDTNGCLSSVQTVNVGHTNTQIIITSVTKTDPTCPGGTGTITINAANGSGYYEFSIDGTNFYPTTAPYTNNYRTFSSGIVAGNYSNITVRDHNTLDTVTYGSTITITDPQGITFGSRTQTDALCGGSATVYLSVTDANGQAKISTDGSTYTNMTYVSPGAYEYTYSFNTVGVHSGTIYYKDSCNQVHTKSYNVSKYNAVSAAVSSVTEPQCPGDDWVYTFALSGGQGTYEYSLDNSTWSSGSTTQVITIPSSTSNSASNETVYFRDAANTLCNTSLLVNNSKVTAVSVSLGSSTDPACSTGTGSFTVIASGGRVDISNTYEYALITTGGTGSYGSSPTFSGLSSGTYNVAVRRSGTACTAANLATDVTITIPTAVIATIDSSVDPTTCAGNDGSITVNVSGGFGIYYYSTNNGTSWSGSPLTPSGGQIIIGSLSAGSYTIKIKDTNGCVMSGSGMPVTLSAPSSPSLGGSYTAPLCYGGNATITLSAGGGTAPYTYSSDGSTYGSSNVFTRSAYSGSQTYYVKDSNNCVTSAGISGSGQPSALILGVTKTNETSAGANDGTITATFSGGSSPYTLSIKDSLGNDIIGSPFTSASSGTIHGGLAPDTYTVSITDDHGCTSSTNTIISAGAAVANLYYFRTNLDGTAPDAYIETSGLNPFGPYSLTILTNTYADSVSFNPATLTTVVNDYVANLSGYAGGTINLGSAAPSGWSAGSPVVFNVPPVGYVSNIHIMVPNDPTYASLTSGLHITDGGLPFNANNVINVIIGGQAYKLYTLYGIVQANGTNPTITIK